MRADDITKTTPLRAWFEKLVDMPAAERRAELSGDRIPDALRGKLAEMVLFHELIPLDEARQERGLRASGLPASVVERVRAMLERQRLLMEARTAGAEELLRELQSNNDDELASQSLIGTIIGNFRLECLIGQGGSSAVFRASRDAGNGTQVVALKLLRTGLYSADAQRRFRREHAILAQLTHPNIATLIEGGLSSAGVPYLAMEFVEGTPITHAANQRRLNVEQRLAWFSTLCRTIEAAHEALIIHRDLKPSNLFITSGGVLKVLDFGIAKAIEEEELTRTQSVALTPAYAAPEQFQSGPLTTAVDVYALGVVLGELLTGQRLNGKKRASQVVAAGTTLLPDGLPPAKSLARRLRGDIDAILTQALADEPAMRYRSAAALGDDIDRLLAAKPVRAHPPSRWYHTRKFISRHRSTVAVTALFLMALMTALALALWQADVARREAHRANTVRDFVQSIFDPLRDRIALKEQPTLPDLLSVGFERVKTAPELDAPERIDLLTMFSRLEADLGDNQRALAIAESAVALASRSLSPTHPLSIAALSARGYAYSQVENYVAASADLREARRLMKLAGLHGQPLLDLLSPLAHIEHIEGNDPAALELAREEMTERIATFGSDDARVGDGYNNLADALEAAERYDESALMWEKTYTFQITHVGPDSDKVSNALAGWGSVNFRAGHWTRARDLLQRALALYDHVGGAAQLDHIWAAQKLCKVDGLLADGDHARQSCARARELSATRFGERSDLHGESLENSASGHIESGDIDRAEREIRQALELYDKTPVNGSRIGISQSDLALIELLTGRPSAARERLPSAIEAMRSVRRYQLPPLVAESRLLLACHQAPAPACPADLREKVERGAAAAIAQDNPQLLWVHTILARLDLDAGLNSEAAERLGRSIMSASRELPSTHPRIVEASLWKAVAEARSEQCPQANRDAAAAMSNVRQSELLQHPMLADAIKTLTAEKKCGPLL